MQFFRGKDCDINEELKEIHERYKTKVEKQGGSQSGKSIFKKITSMAFFKPFSCVGILYTLCEWNGISPVLIYMIHILQKAGSSIDAELSPIIIGGIRLITAGKLMNKFIIIQTS